MFWLFLFLICEHCGVVLLLKTESIYVLPAWNLICRHLLYCMVFPFALSRSRALLKTLDRGQVHTSNWAITAQKDLKSRLTQAEKMQQEWRLGELLKNLAKAKPHVMSHPLLFPTNCYFQISLSGGQSFPLQGNSGLVFLCLFIPHPHTTNLFLSLINPVHIVKSLSLFHVKSFNIT